MYNEIFYSNDNELIATTQTLFKSHQHNIKQKKSDTKTSTLYNSIYTAFKQSKLTYGMKVRVVVSFGGEGVPGRDDEGGGVSAMRYLLI